MEKNHRKQKTPYPMLSGDTDKLFSFKTVLLAAVGLAINILLANFIIWLKLPIYVDNVGSVLVGALAGPIPGMTVGFLSNVINSFGDPITMYYGILTVIMAMLASFYTQRGLFRQFKGVLFVIFSFVMTGGGVGSVMTWLLYGGGIGGIGAPFAIRLHQMGLPAFLSQLCADILIDIPDKTITVLLVLLALKFCVTFFPGAFPLSFYYSNSGSGELTEENRDAPSQHSSVKTLILRLIIVCSSCISVANILISYLKYCGVEKALEHRLAYLIQLISVSFAITLLICSVTIWVASKRIVEPVGHIVKQSREFRKIPSEAWLTSEIWKNRIPIETGDEMEELYHTICAEQETVAKNVIQMKATEEKLRHSKELEDALENARQASKAKGQFLSRMSHEIRTPLNAVIGYMDIAKDSVEQPDKMLHCVENSQLAAKHLLNIINDVLDISSIESGKMKIAREEFNLKEQIATVSTLFYNQSKKKKVQFVTVISELTQEWVVGDCLRMNQVLMNLLSNAVKFTEEGGTVSLTVAQMKQTDQNLFLKFIVSDTGIGMSEEFKSRLFTPFEQESATTAQKYGGTGLGLSITANLVSMMGGAIDIKSAQGEGTTFTVTIPFALSKEEHEKPELERYRKLRALVVEGTLENGENVKNLLLHCGVKSDVVTSGEAAARQIKKRKNTEYSYDFCIFDWNLFGQGEASLIQTICQKQIGKVPVFVATAYDITEMEEEAKKTGVDQILSRPLFQSTIFDFLVSTYGKHKSEPEMKKTDSTLAGTRILLAEDNAMNREIAVDILTKAKIMIDTAQDGKETVKKFCAHPDDYDAILMDIQMPVMDGYEATKAIRELSLPQGKTIPIIAMTANAFHEDVARALASGMNEHIAKPIDYDKLFRVLQKIRR